MRKIDNLYRKQKGLEVIERNVPQTAEEFLGKWKPKKYNFAGSKVFNHSFREARETEINSHFKR